MLEVGGNQSLAGLCEMGFVVYRGVKSITGFCDGRKSSKMKRENVTRGYPYDCFGSDSCEVYGFGEKL